MRETEIYKSETLEHLGSVAGMFDELGIGDLVDELLPQDLSQRKVSVGQALKAMVLNGLGFANRRLCEITLPIFKSNVSGGSFTILTPFLVLLKVLPRIKKRLSIPPWSLGFSK